MSIYFSPHNKAFTKNIILGTAGHVGHGKTAFIRALTGIDCDRLKEEKEQRITIELGYAHMRLPSGAKVGIVDVPGHERFVSKMVAGTAGIDVLALLIAADEGIKPQTYEHLNICEMLGIKKGIIILNKKDLADDDLLLLQTEEIETFVASTFLEGAPIIPVSSINGEGIEEFIHVLDRIAANITEKPAEKPFRLPVDAVLTITGFGTVVRGTALSGHITAGEEVVVLPGGRKSRIRGLQNHGQTIDEGYAGERLAINLADMKKKEIEKGMVVARSGFFCQSNTFLTELSYLPYNKKPLTTKSMCQFHVLAAKVNAEVHLLYEEKLPPGEKGWAVVKTVRPLVVSHGDTFVMMGCGSDATIGGGRILNPVLPRLSGQSITEKYVQILSGGALKEKITLFIHESGTNGIALLSLCGILNEGEGMVRKHVLELKGSAVIYEDEKYHLFHRDYVLALQENIRRIIDDYHRINPLRLGISKEELFNRTTAKSGLFHLVMSLMIQGGCVEIISDLVKAKKFNIRQTASGLILQRVQRKYFKHGLKPETPPEAAKKINIEKSQFMEVLHSLARSGHLIKISEDYYLHPHHFEYVVSSIKVFFENNLVLTPSDVRDMLGLSRKYIMPLLEYLDSIKMTVRTPEGRRLRK
jgi:selenocysteine-specific elongation factor